MSETSPLLAALHDQPAIELPEVVAAATGMACTVPEFANQSILGVKIPFGWLEHGGVDVELSLQVAHDVHGLTPTEDYAKFGTKAGIYCRATIGVEDTITDWPAEVKDESILSDDALAEVEEGFVITRHHIMEVGFATTYLMWGERYEYVMHNPELERIIDASDMTVDSEEPHDPGVAVMEIDSEEAALFATICGDFAAASRAARDQHRMRQVLAILESVRGRQPFSTQAFFESPYGTTT